MRFSKLTITMVPIVFAVAVLFAFPYTTSAAAAISYLQSDVLGGPLSEFTFSSQNFGAASANRVLIVVVRGAPDNPGDENIINVTIGGVTATIHSQTFDPNSGHNVAIVSAPVPTGTSGSVVVTFSGTNIGSRISLFSATGIGTGASVYDTATDLDDVVSMSIDMPERGILVAGANFGNAGAITTVGVTEDDEGNDTAAGHAGPLNVETNRTVSFDGPTGDAAGVAVSWAVSRTVLSKPPNNLGLVGYWSFDEGTSTKATDFSGNGNFGTTTGGPTWTNGKLGNALAFTNNQFVGIGNVSTLDVTSAGTVSAWIYINEKTGFPMLVSKFNWANDTNGYHLALNASGDHLSVGVADATTYESIDNGNTELQLNRWYHVAMTWDGTTIRAYVNGSPDGSISQGGVTPTPQTQNFNIVKGDGTAANFRGKIDEVRVYNRALGATEIAALAKSGAVKFTSNSKTLTQGSSLENGLVGLWTFDGADVNWTSDSAGTTRDGSVSNNTGTITNMNRRTSVDGGALGQAFSFDGSNDYVDIGDKSFLDAATSASVCAWMNYTPSGVNVDGAIVTEFNGSGWLLFVDDAGGVTGRTNTISFVIDNSVSAEGRVEGSTNLVRSRVWDHYCGVFVGGTSVTLYRNGVQDQQNTTSIVSAVQSTSASVRIGGTAEGSPGRPLNAKLDDVRIYNRALTAAEVKQLYLLGGATIRP